MILVQSGSDPIDIAPSLGVLVAPESQIAVSGKTAASSTCGFVILV
ncbi:hypothetical protein COLINT_03198 [Collinsella intestinalis DSM 13280]|uniref:Uncharacterized protein n=1 Tax=Collinsella intestinalis DSM 13280 TaxID=521003 RepID=C4FAV2_9ACTN|nr:hypothetical protein COLINT_03198 [Collinsella intestinalis DSM 13280]